MNKHLCHYEKHTVVKYYSELPGVPNKSLWSSLLPKPNFIGRYIVMDYTKKLDYFYSYRL